jgi:hypothetical protein
MAQGVFMFHMSFSISCDFPKQHSLDMDCIFCEVGADFIHKKRLDHSLQSVKSQGFMHLENLHIPTPQEYIFPLLLLWHNH